MRGILVLMVIYLGCFVLGCSGHQAQTKPTFKWHPNVTGKDYMPSQDGMIWAYEIQTPQNPSPMLVVSKVVLASPLGVEIDNGQGNVIGYQYRDGGLYKNNSRYFLLKTPIQAGNAWDTPEGIKISILSTDAKIETPMGALEPCVVVEELQSDIKIQTSFAPNIGIVKVQYWQADQLQQTLLLRSYSAEPLDNANREMITQ